MAATPEGGVNPFQGCPAALVGSPKRVLAGIQYGVCPKNVDE
jgi:hypothetical protein